MAEISSKSRLSDTKLVALPEVDYISLIWSRRPNRMGYSSDENCIRFMRRGSMLKCAQRREKCLQLPSALRKFCWLA